MSKKQQTFRRVLTFVLAAVLALGFLSTLAFTVGAETVESKETAKFITQPVNAAAPDGTSVKVTVKASGDGLKYAWYHQQKGKTSFTKSKSLTSNYFTVKMTSAWDGAKIRCIITDQYGNVAKSDITTIYMGNPAKITTQPKSIAVVVGKTASVTVKATGDGLTYTWYHKNAGAAKYSKSSTVTNTYKPKMTEAMDGRTAYCVVTDKYGTSVKSSVATITKANPAKITTQPKSVVVESGSTAKVTVKATGDGLTYAWYYAKKGSSKFTKTSVTSASYSVKMSSSVNGRKVYCVVTDKYGNTAKSSTVTLSMGKFAKITTQPKSTVVIVGKTVSISVKATGDGLTYTWYHKNAGAAKYSKSSTVTNTYKPKMTEAMDGRTAYCVVTDKYGNTVKSSVVTITKANLATITTQPKNATAPSGSTAKVTIKATGDGLTYTWYYAKKGSTKFTKLSTTSATYSLKMSSSNDGRKVYCVVKDKHGTSVKSSVVTLYMGNPVKITTQPKGVTTTPDHAVKVTVKATGDGLKYQWYYKNPGSASFKKYAAGTAATYSTKMSTGADGRQVYCVVTDKYGNTAKSSTVTLKQRPFTEEELMSPYVKPLMEDIAAATKAHMKEDSLCFVLFTDTHYKKKDTLFQTVLAKRLAQATNASAVVHLGDLAYMLEDNKAAGLDIFRRHTDILQDCKIPYLQVVGSNDDGHLHPHYKTNDFSAKNYIKSSEMFEAIMGRLQNNIVLGSKNGWYYMDDEKSKTRMIVMNSHDYPWVVNKDGTLAYDSDYKTGVIGVYSAEQLEWLANTALNFADKGDVEEQAKWSVLAFAHVGTSNWTTINSLFTAFSYGHKKTDFNSLDEDQIDTYGLYDYSNIEITNDFSLVGARKIAFFCSNRDSDELIDKHYPIINCLDSKYDSEKLGTPEETAISVMVVTPSEDKITELRFGAGTKTVKGKEVPIDPLKDYDNYRVFNY